MKFNVILLLLSTLTSGLASLSYPEVTIDNGKLQGKFIETFSHRKISAFLGVPYARPPIGIYRFEAPIPAEVWPGILNATYTPTPCVQYSHFEYKTHHAVHGSEDCLYLNIYTPKVSGDFQENLVDVIVYIHGGAFMFLSGAVFGPEYLLDRNVVLVTLNYRLGPLGFLSTEDTVVPGNNGLKDQLLALKWVNNNIKAFGGDPHKITLAGMSAGGTSVHYQVISPKAKGLFKQAIMLSGTALCPWSQTENSKIKAQILAQNLGCPISSTREMVNCLKARPAYDIVRLSKLFMPWLYNPYSPFGPVVEPQHSSAFIDTPPSKIIKNYLSNDVPLLLSFTADEGLYPGSEIIADDALVKDLTKNWNKLLPHLLDFNFTIPENKKIAVSEEIRSHFLGMGSIKDKYKNFVEMLGERLFKLPIAQTAKLHASYCESPVYTYRFSHIGRRRGSDYFNLKDIFKGACHGDDLQYILKVNEVLKDDDTARIISKRMIDIWMDFIQGKQRNEHWRPVKENLPMFSFLDIVSANPNEDSFMKDSDFASERFWTGLNFNENIDSESIHTEL